MEKALKPPKKDAPSEEQRLYASRIVGLLGLGFSPEQAFVLSGRADVVHDAADLLARGAPHEFVVNEFTD